MNEYKRIIKKLEKGSIITMIERKKRERYDLERSLECLKLNPKYDDGSNARAIERLNHEIDVLNEVYSEN